MRRAISSAGAHQSISKAVRRSSGSSVVPRISRGTSAGGSGCSPAANLRTVWATQSMAASATRPLYRALLPMASGRSKVEVAQMGPASISSTAESAVTPQRARRSRIAWSSEDGPRSPTGPGWTMTVVHRRHTSSGTRCFRKGHRIRSGSIRATSRVSDSGESNTGASSTPTSCPCSRREHQTRWVRPLKADTSSRIFNCDSSGGVGSR